MDDERLLHCELMELHCVPKFLADVESDVQPGQHLVMESTIPPCRAGCSPAIRRFVYDRQCSAEFKLPDRTIMFRLEDEPR